MHFVFLFAISSRKYSVAFEFFGLVIKYCDAPDNFEEGTYTYLLVSDEVLAVGHFRSLQIYDFRSGGRIEFVVVRPSFFFTSCFWAVSCSVSIKIPSKKLSAIYILIRRFGQTHDMLTVWKEIGDGPVAFITEYFSRKLTISAF